MPMERCSSGHIYDTGKHPSCPFCAESGVDMEKTRPVGEVGNPSNTELKASDDSTRQHNVNVEEDKTLGSDNRGNDVHSSESDKTIAFWKEKIGIDPVVGWLVCVEGADKGRDFRIRMGQNTIGRGDNVNISIKGDNTISSQSHAARVIYEPVAREFVLIPGQGRALTYLNGSGVYMPTPLAPFNRVKIGNTELIFLPLCGEEFAWDISE